MGKGPRNSKGWAVGYQRSYDEWTGFGQIWKLHSGLLSVSLQTAEKMYLSHFMLEATLKKESSYLLRRPDRSHDIEGIQRGRDGKNWAWVGLSQSFTNQWVLALTISCLMRWWLLCYFPTFILFPLNPLLQIIKDIYLVVSIPCLKHINGNRFFIGPIYGQGQPKLGHFLCFQP